MGQMGCSGSDWHLGINKTKFMSPYGYTVVFDSWFYKIVKGQVKQFEFPTIRMSILFKEQPYLYTVEYCLMGVLGQRS